MKNFILLLACSFFLTQSVLADKIITWSADTIDCKVVKVGTSVIEYKKSLNLDGPIYEIGKSKVSTIFYDNGESDVFDINKTPNESKLNDIQKSLSSGCVELLRNTYFYKGTLARKSPKNPNRLFLLKRTQIKNVMNCADPMLGDRYYHFSRMQGAGGTLILFGLLTTSGGVTLAVTSDSDERKFLTGLGVSTLGVTMCCAGIPLAAVGRSGKYRQLRRLKTLVEEGKIGCEESAQDHMFVSITAKKNGLGLLLTF